jgi:hypothetical protein
MIKENEVMYRKVIPKERFYFCVKKMEIGAVGRNEIYLGVYFFTRGMCSHPNLLWKTQVVPPTKKESQSPKVSP